MKADSPDRSTFVSGKMLNFSIRVDKKAASGQYHLTLVSESITQWENDLVSHDATAKEYVIVNSTAGHLKEAIAAANKDFTKLKHLKVKGTVNAYDFHIMRDSMFSLTALNLKEVRIKASNWNYQIMCEDDEMPTNCFEFKQIGRAHV